MDLAVAAEEPDRDGLHFVVEGEIDDVEQHGTGDQAGFGGRRGGFRRQESRQDHREHGTKERRVDLLQIDIQAAAGVDGRGNKNRRNCEHGRAYASHSYLLPPAGVGLEQGQVHALIEQGRGTVQDAVEGAQNRTDHYGGEEAGQRCGQHRLHERRVRLQVLIRAQRVLEEVIRDDAWKHDRERRDQFEYGGNQDALLRFFQVLCTERTLHDGLIGAPEKYLVDDHAGEQHTERQEGAGFVSGNVEFGPLLRVHGVEALQHIAIADQRERQNRNEQAGNEESDAIDRIGYRDRLEAAQNGVGRTQPANPDDHEPGGLGLRNAQRVRHIEKGFQAGRPEQQYDRQNGNGVREKEQNRCDDPRCTVETRRKKIGDGGQACTEVPGDEVECSQNHGQCGGRLPRHDGDCVVECVPVQSDQVLGGQVGQHQGAGNHPCSQTPSRQEVGLGRLHAVLAGGPPRNRGNRPGERKKGKTGNQLLWLYRWDRRTKLYSVDAAQARKSGMTVRRVVDFRNIGLHPVWVRRLVLHQPCNVRIFRRMNISIIDKAT